MPFKSNLLSPALYLLLFISAGLFSTATSAEASSSEWEFELTPYLWATGFESHTIADNSSSSSDSDYSYFAVDHLDAVASFALEARKGRWSMLFDGFYAKYSDSQQSRFLDKSLALKLGFIEVGAGYQIIQDKDISVIFGARSIYTDSTFEITPGPKVTLRKTWLDPFIGLKGTLPVTDSWSISMRGDIGGKNDADYVLNTLLSADYKITDAIKVKLGYRYMKMKLKQNKLVQDISLSGVQLGLGISF